MENNYQIRITLLLLFTSLFSAFSFAQVTQAWVRSYEGLPDIDYPVTTRIAVDGLGNVIAAGQNFASATEIDLVVIKYNAAGAVLWTRRSSQADFVRDLTVDASGHIYVTGEGAISGLFDYVTIKYDAAGNELWTKTYNGPGNGNDIPASIALDASGNVYVTGTSFGGSETLEDYATVKYDAAGNELWVKRYNGPSNAEDLATALDVDALGNVYITGWSNGELTTIKYDTNGNELWVRRRSGNGVASLAVDASQNVYVMFGIGTDFAIIKYDTHGNELWVRTYNGTGNGSDVAQALTVDALGNVYVTGRSDGNGTGVDYATVKYNTAGDQLWVNRFAGPANSFDFPVAIAVDGAGNAYVTGISGSIGADSDIATVKYDTQGNESWVIRYNGPDDTFEGANDIAVNGSGNVYVSGASFHDAFKTDYITIKYVQTVVTDVSCGKKGDKVMVCHKGKTICISANAVAAHLRHGDKLGSCSGTPALNSIAENTDLVELSEEITTQFRVLVAPNPLQSLARLQYELPFDGEVSIKVYDVIGREVATVVKSVQKSGVYSVGFNATDLAKGVYYYRALLTTKQKMYTQTGKLMVVK